MEKQMEQCSFEPKTNVNRKRGSVVLKSLRSKSKSFVEINSLPISEITSVGEQKFQSQIVTQNLLDKVSFELPQEIILGNDFHKVSKYDFRPKE